MEDYQKKCPTCDKVFKAKRLNQVYCKTTCKSLYNNRIARKKGLTAKAIKAITTPYEDLLWKNRCLLKKYEGVEKSLSELVAEGFQLNYITYFKKDEGDATKNIFFIYDTAYRFKDVSTVQILTVNHG